MADPLNPALRAVSDAVLAVAAQRSVEDVLQQLVDSARELAGARYAALGTPDGEGGFTRFLVAGMSDELIASLGPLPRRHGMLAAMLETSEPYLTEDIHAHPRFRGWWPSRHPDMRSFLGVPIVAPEGVIGAFYLTEKESGGLFDHADQAVIELLAAHAAIAITNAGLYERSRELSMLEARNRLALELHDAVSQKLFSLVLTAEAAGEQLARDPEAARASFERLRALAAEALEELRSLILELRPPELERDGLCGALRKHVEMLRRLHHVQIDVEIDDAAVSGAGAVGASTAATAATAAARGGARDREILRVAQEALQNAIRHAAPHRLGLRLGRHDGRLALEVTDDGAGFDPAEPELRSRRLGLTSMEERAQRLGGTLEIRSAPGAGTTVRLEAPVD
jgi:signal transduction histidine kinase